MKLGAGFPQDETTLDRGAVRAFAQAAEDLGYDLITGGEHVLGIDPTNRPGWSGPYTHKNVWHEPMVLLPFIAACTRRVLLGTSILVLPQRQAALVAKQTAEIDLLSSGRLRLGLGVGWNEVEFEGVGAEFKDRAARMEEQIQVLRLLWTQNPVTFHGKWHHISEAGINPLPIQRPIPIWFGGGAGPVLRRVARVGDGWIPDSRIDSVRPQLERLRAYLREAGRDPDSIDIIGRYNVARDDAATLRETAEAWRQAGATFVTTSTNGAGFTSIDQHIAALRRFKEAVGSP